MGTRWTMLGLTIATLAISCNAEEIWLPYGRLCDVNTPTAGVCNPQHHLSCTDDGESTTTKCWCREGMYHDSLSPTVCIVKQNSTCEERPNFGWSTVCTPNAYCELANATTGTCLCNQASIPSTSGTYCKLTNGYGPCIQHNECATNVHLMCHSGKCACDADGTDAEWSGGECLGLVGKTCNPRSCTHGANCTVAGGVSQCSCMADQFLEHESKCLLNYGGDCSSGPEQCHPLFHCHQNETNPTCKCDAKYVDHVNTCTLQAGALCDLSPNTTFSRKCSRHSNCTEDATDQQTKCLCDSGYSHTNDFRCTPTHGMDCDTDWGCNAALHFTCNGTSSLCTCAENYTWVDPQCLGLFGAENCGGHEECITQFCDPDSRCACPTGTAPYETSSGTKCGGPEGHSCSAHEECRPDKYFECLNQVCGCSDDKLSENEECKIKAGNPCEIGSGANCIDGSSCFGGNCTCTTGMQPGEEGRCVPAPPLTGSARVATLSTSMLVIFLVSGAKFLA